MHDLVTDKIRINNDSWDDIGKIYRVLQYSRREDSTAVELVLEYRGNRFRRTVAYHSIEWVY